MNYSYKKIFSHNHHRGAAAITAILFFVIISTVFVLGISGPVVSNYTTTRDLGSSKGAYYLSESGLEDAVYRIKNGITIGASETLSLEGNKATTTISGTGTKTIASIGDITTNTRRIGATLSPGTSADFIYALQAGEGGIQFGSDFWNKSIIRGIGGIDGNIYSNGPIVGGAADTFPNLGSEVQGSVYSAGGSVVDTGAEWTTGNTDQNIGQTSPYIDYMQQFTAGTTTNLLRTSLFIKEEGVIDSLNIYVRILPDVAGSPGTTAIASTKIVSSGVPGNYGWFDVYFTTPAPIVSGEKYWIVIDMPGANGSNYIRWYRNSGGGYAGGIAVSKSDYTTAGAGTAVTGDFEFRNYIFSNAAGSITKIKVDTNAYAHTVTNSTIAGVAYCQTGSGNDKSCDTSLQDPMPATPPVSQSTIDEWKATATAGGTITGDCYWASGCSSTMGPIKINGNLGVQDGHNLTLTGVVYVTGYVYIGSGNTLRCDPSYGANSCIIIADGYIKQQGTVTGSGTAGSYVILLTTLAGCIGVTPAPSTCTDNYSGIRADGGGSIGAILYAPDSQIYLGTNASSREMYGYKIYVGQNTTVEYETGLASQNFISGPTGGWNISSWEQGE